MDVTLGVSIAGTDARIALLDVAPPHTVIDQFELDLAGEPISTLATTLISTDRALSEAGHRLVGTRVCSSDDAQTTALRDALIDADLMNVTVVPQPDAVSAVARLLAPGETVASLVTDGDTAALSIVDADTDTTSLIAVEPINQGDRGAAYRALLDRFSEEPGGATSVIVWGGPSEVGGWSSVRTEASPIPLRFPDAPEFAVARGAAMAGLWGSDTGGGNAEYPDLDIPMADTVLGPQSQQLAYSEVEDTDSGRLVAADVPMQTPMRPLSAIDPDEVDDDVAAPVDRPKVLLLGSTVAAVVVVGFAALAVTVAINIRPEVSDQAVRLQNETVGGKYFPVSPGQGEKADGDNWTMVEELPPPGSDTDGVRVFKTQSLSSARGTGGAGPRMVSLYPDGTVGLPRSPGITPPPPVGNVGVAPQIMDFVPRLIPDFSQVSLCQVLGFVANMQAVTEQAAQSVSVPLSNVLDPVNGLTLKDVGVVAAVQEGRGALFDTDQVKGVKGVVPGEGSVIPKEIFKAGDSQFEPVGALPPGTALIEKIPTPVQNETTGKVTDFGGVITNLDEVLPGPEGAGSRLQQSVPKVDESLPGTSGIPPAKTSPILDPAETVSIPGSIPGGIQKPGEIAPKPDGVLPKPSSPFPDFRDVFPGKPNPGVTVPKEDVPLPAPGAVLPDEPIVAPKPPSWTPKSPIFSPKEPAQVVPNPPVQVIPDPPVQVIPDPPVQVIPSPPVQVIPDPPVQAPIIDVPVQAPPVQKPIFDLPIPKFEIPKPAAPVEPVAPQAPSLPTLPGLPNLGGLFG